VLVGVFKSLISTALLVGVKIGISILGSIDSASFAVNDLTSAKFREDNSLELRTNGADDEEVMMIW